MGGFYDTLPWGGDDDTSQTADTSDEEEIFPNDEDDEVTVRVEEWLYNRHTVHLGVATFADDDSRTFMFDYMTRKGDSIVLYDYIHNGTGSRSKEAFITIPHANLKTFETIRREEVKINYSYRERDKDMERENAEKYVEDLQESDHIKNVEIVEDAQ